MEDSQENRQGNPGSNVPKKGTVILASDHAGFKLKESIKIFLTGEGYKTEDVGAMEYHEEDDYPEFVAKAAQRIATNPDSGEKAIVFGGSGQGEAIVANRFPGVRAAVWYGNPWRADQKDLNILRLSREHNDANVLSVGARYVEEEDAKKAITMWLSTPFSGEERHLRRIEEIDSIE